MTWYLVRTNIKSEDKAERNLRRAGFATYAPWQAFEKFNKRRRKFIEVRHRIAPRYLFISIESQRDETPWGLIRACEGVEEIIPRGRPPVRLNDNETKALTAIMEAEQNFAFDETRAGKLHRREIGKTKRETTKIKFPVGSSVRVKDGPFTSFAGEVVNVNGRGHIKALVSIFGRLTEIELESGQVEAMDKAA